MKQEWLTQGDIDDHIRRRVAEQLFRDVANYGGSPVATKEILRGLAAARAMGIDLSPFEDALAGGTAAAGWCSRLSGPTPRGVPGA
jgi:hypothetical protein